MYLHILRGNRCHVLGQRRLLPWFFFVLDVISTATLLLDISVIADYFSAMLTSNDEDNASNMRGSKSARIGAKASRMVKLVRLIRIFKLYKNFTEHKKRKAGDNDNAPGGLDEWDAYDDFAAEAEPRNITQSRVGKKLTEMTTRRVIILVLTVLIVLPILQVDEGIQVATSADFGADVVMQKFEEKLLVSSEPLANTTEQTDYEESMIKYVLFHNWFAGVNNLYCPGGQYECADYFYNHLFWFGVTGNNLTLAKQKGVQARLSEDLVTSFNSEQLQQRNIFNYGWMPSSAQALLSSSWTVSHCPTTPHVSFGISLLAEAIDGVIKNPVRCPDALRTSEWQRYVPRSMSVSEYEDWHFVFYFDLRETVKAESVYNLCLTSFVIVLLCIGSLVFTNDANILVLHPVEKMIRRARKAMGVNVS
eukprot:NODE_5400_length_1775_cov_5.751214.p1 GENE.NODE_5400_length_1775_cov_5.751214~~NODE_5400_length_1775_cov_5.751214.p1  ORF type:complete len:420 (-),score=57.07 NODE_5400_length_1775_cov_5.751214:287-1546(-)